MMRILIVAAAAAAIAAGASAADSTRLVTVVASGDAQTQLMAMVLTAQAQARGVPAQVLLCGPAGDVALNDAPESATAPQKPRGASPQGLLRQIMANGAPVAVCAIYLPNKGVGPEALIEGVTVAEPPAMAEQMLAVDTRVWSF